MAEADDSFVISSLVVECAPEYVDAVADKIRSFDGAEVHEINGYKIVVTIEAPTVDESHAIANAFVPITGVIGVNLIYMNFEEDKSLYPEGV